MDASLDQAKGKTKTLTRCIEHFTISVEDMVRHDLATLVDLSEATMSLKSVQISAYGSSITRIKEALSAQGYDLKWRWIGNSNRAKISFDDRMKYDPDYIVRPLAHGDFLRMKSSSTADEFCVLLLREGELRLFHAGGMYKNTLSITRSVLKRVEAADVPEEYLKGLQRHLDTEKTGPTLVRVQVKARTPIDPELLAYMQSRGATTTECTDSRGAEGIEFTVVMTERAQKLLRSRCWCSYSRRSRRQALSAPRYFDGVFETRYEVIEDSLLSGGTLTK